MRRNLEIAVSPSVPQITCLWADEIRVIYLLKRITPLPIKHLYESDLGVTGVGTNVRRPISALGIGLTATTDTLLKTSIL